MNLFPEVKATIQDVLRSDSQLKNADVELQQRAVEYLRLSTVASTDILVRALGWAVWCWATGLVLGVRMSHQLLILPSGNCPGGNATLP